MTKILPANGLAPHTPAAKVNIYHVLAKGLPPTWRAWCGVKVCIPGPVYGEADFLIANPERGLLILWVMDGRIEQLEGRWYRNQQEMLASPLDQAYGFRSKLQRALKNYGEATVPIGVAVCFPDSADFNQTFAQGKAASVTLFASQTANLIAHLPALFDATLVAGGSLSTKTLLAIDRLFNDGQSSANSVS